jgi:hypothetical protein
MKGNTGAAVAIFGTLFVGYLYLSGKLGMVWAAISGMPAVQPVIAGVDAAGNAVGAAEGAAAGGVAGGLSTPQAAPPPNYQPYNGPMVHYRDRFGNPTTAPKYLPQLPPGIFIH